MARTSSTPADAVGRATAARIVDAATIEFYEHGFHGASLRDLAARAGIRSATLYYHFASKEEVLVAIMRTTLEDLHAHVERVLASHAGVVEQFGAAIRAHIHFHVASPRQVFLCDAELRALGPENRSAIVALRDRYEHMLGDVLRRGADAGTFDVPDPELFTRSLLASCSAVASWFRPDGRMSVDAVVDRYVDLFLRALGAR